MKKLKLLSVLVLLLLSLAILLSCSSDDGGDTGANTPQTNGKTVTLNVYNWGEYISDGFEDTLDVNKEFEKYYLKKFGVKVEVNYTTYETNEYMYSKLTSGAGTYDIIIPSDYMIQKLKDEDMLLPFDANTIENYKYIKDTFKGMYYDTEEMYSVPYTYGMIGVIYNRELVDEADYSKKSWNLLWNENYRGKILQFNNPRDAFGTAMYLMGLDVNTADKSVWDAALAKLSEQKPLVQGYVSDEIFNKMTTASAAIAPYYAGDFLTMYADNTDLGFYYPTEGANYFVDAMCIPKNSRQPDIAKEYINFMLSEEIAVANALYIGYASPNKLVVDGDYINADYEAGMLEIADNAIEILYGESPDDINKAYVEAISSGDYVGTPCYKSFSPEIQEYVNTLWESLKTQNSTPVWVHVATAIIVVGIATLAAYNVYVKKKRSRWYRMRDKQKKAKT